MFKILILILMASCQSSAKKMPVSENKKIFNPKNNVVNNEFIVKIKDKFVKGEKDLELDFKYIAPVESVSKIRTNFYLIKFKDDKEVKIKELQDFRERFNIDYLENIEPNFKVTLY